MEYPFTEWLAAFAQTCAVELPLYLLFLRGRFAKWWHALAVVFLLQVATHPAVWYLAPRMDDYWMWFTVVELSVVCAEALLLWATLGPRPSWKANFGRALNAAYVANSVSALWGLFYYRYLG